MSKIARWFIAAMLLLVLAIVIVLGYWLQWDWTGLKGKTLWDWLQLLIIPSVLAIAGYVFTLTTNKNERRATEQRSKDEQRAIEQRDKTEREIALENQQEVILQDYIDKLSELILEKKLRESKPEDEIRNIARVRTLTVLPRLTSQRKRIILQFLHESGLIDTDASVIDLRGSDLIGANLSGAHLTGAHLTGACLIVAHLIGTHLSNANLSGVDLTEAYLIEAHLSNANLSNANLSGVHLTGAFLTEAFLEGANLSRAHLIRVDLTEACLDGANLSDADLALADLSRASLDGTNLSGANLSGAKITQKQLKRAGSLTGATMPDGSKHP